METRRLVGSLFIALAVITPAHRLSGQGNEGYRPGITITGNVLTSFKNGLQAELDHRRATVKRLASLKTPDQYRTCVQTVASSGEGQKILMGPANLPASATTDQIQKATEKMSADLAKLSTDKCGEDPREYDDGWRSRQVQAAEDAGAKAFGAGLPAPPGGTGPYLAFEQRQDRTLGYYRQLKEWVAPFCNLPKAEQQAAAEKGVSVPGKDKRTTFVYTVADARLLMQHCDELMTLLRELE